MTMRRIVTAECRKLKRYSILWAGVALMLLSVLLTLFTSTANDGMEWTFPILVEQVVKNNMTTIFPACITLTAGYLIAREQKDRTLKNILTVPLSFRRLLIGKLLVCGLLSLFLGLVCTAFTFWAQWFMGFPGFCAEAAVRGLGQITLTNLFLYIAVLPGIILTSRSENGFLAATIVAFVYGYGSMFAAANMKLANLYPVTAGLGILRYRSYDSAVHWNTPLCCMSLFCMLALSALLLNFAGKQPEDRKMPLKKIKPAHKKGW